MKRKHKIPQGWTKIIFKCCNQCAFDAREFLRGSEFEVSEMSKLGTFRVKLKKWEAVRLLNDFAGFTNDEKATNKRYEAKGR